MQPFLLTFLEAHNILLVVPTVCSHAAGTGFGTAASCFACLVVYLESDMHSSPLLRSPVCFQNPLTNMIMALMSVVPPTTTSS